MNDALGPVSAQPTELISVPFDSHRLHLNEPVPDFDARTTHGPRHLSDYRGRWLVLFSYPADFTQVCTTELIAFAQHYDEFLAMNCELLGVSLDSNYVHLAWIRDIKERFGVEIRFPVVEEMSMKVAAHFGMLDEGSSGQPAVVPSLFVIDDEGVLRAMIFHPLSNGQSIPGLLRLVGELQGADKFEPGIPVNPSLTFRRLPTDGPQAATRQGSTEADYVDWYF